MKIKEIIPFIGKDIWLVFPDGHAREGRITELIDDDVFFQLSDSIASIKPWVIALILLKR